MSDADCTPGREPCSVAASYILCSFVLNIKRYIGVEPIKSKYDTYVAPSSVNDIDKIGSMMFAINRCICVPK